MKQFRHHWLLSAALALPFLAVNTPIARAQNYFGAISYSESTGSHGYSYDYSTQGAAENRAQRECESVSGRGDCRVLVWFRNACGALAVASNGAYGSGWGASRALAERYAVQTCQQYGGTACRVTRWVCTTR